MGFSGTPNNGTPLWQASHTIPISLGILMGIVWEAYHKGVPKNYWGSLKIPLTRQKTRSFNSSLSSTAGRKSNESQLVDQVSLDKVLFNFHWSNDRLPLSIDFKPFFNGKFNYPFLIVHVQIIHYEHSFSELTGMSLAGVLLFFVAFLAVPHVCLAKLLVILWPLDQLSLVRILM